MDIALTVAVPGVVPAIKDTVTMPESLDVHPESLVPPGKLPKVVVNDTWVPKETGLPELLCNVAVIVEELNPSGGIQIGSAVSVIEAVSPLEPVSKGTLIV